MFITRESLNPHGAPVLRREILANSITVTEGDSVKWASGFAALGTTGALVLGHVVSIGTNHGVGVNSTGAAGAEFGSFVNTFLTASDNQTVAKVRADIDISKFTIYAADADATLGSTTGSNLAGYRMDIVSEEELDESTAATSSAQYGTFGVDSIDTQKALVNIYESQVFGI